ncbi:hypothetical protein Tco_0876776, partial [Tanacetum coccineum]
MATTDKESRAAGKITTESVQRRAPVNKGKHAATRSQGKV